MTLALAVPLATNNFGDDLSGGLAGPVALLIVVLLGIATVLLWRNMNSRLRRLPSSFEGADRIAGEPSGAANRTTGPARSAGANVDRTER